MTILLDAGRAQNARGDPDAFPGESRNALALAVALGHGDERHLGFIVLADEMLGVELLLEINTQLDQLHEDGTRVAARGDFLVYHLDLLFD